MNWQEMKYLRIDIFLNYLGDKDNLQEIIFMKTKSL